ncbi:Uu.00g075480.m01.CDS01 [Anthostomella pinea]|uniref:Uu.00g075480.m01.CDS01 n=1 Tax=Anthostomella pinea TaxID=933095 RepID=A0AAI8VWW2_9PEZI|nr:Uu.00g075480.m01.CDS01 [Anthostomella pinea]
MSASAPHSTSLPTDITCIAAEPFEPKPLIADILRTRFCVPGSIFLVEGVHSVHTSRSKRWRALRLLLGDGELSIQALLSAELHRYIDRGEVAFGSYIRLEQFRVEWKASSGNRGSSPTKRKGKEKAQESEGEERGMVYLIVEDLALVGWNNALVDSEIGEAAETGPFYQAEEEKNRQGTPGMSDPIDHTQLRRKSIEPAENRGIEEHLKDPADADDDFESMPISDQKATQNRIAIATNASSTELDVQPISSYLPWAGNDPSKPLKLTKLRSIPNLPYKQNWSVNVLAVVSAISDVEPSGLPPYTQRQARLADPSTDKHVLLTVFLDPHLFAPSVGSVVLLLGVKNHRFDGGSLKKYVSDRPRDGEGWWFENPSRFSWCDVAGLQQWWNGDNSWGDHDVPPP